MITLLICALRVSHLPLFQGFDGAGVVAAVGPGVVKFKNGDRVYVTKCITGTYATHCIAYRLRTLTVFCVDRLFLRLLSAQLCVAQ